LEFLNKKGDIVKIFLTNGLNTVKSVESGDFSLKMGVTESKSQYVVSYDGKDFGFLTFKDANEYYEAVLTASGKGKKDEKSS
jgi:sRNA-binding regulator protein Hfq